MAMSIYTSTIRYTGNKKKIDITVKSASGIGNYFKPTWDMVWEYKRTKNEEKYTQQYLDILEENYYYIRRMIEFLEAGNDVVFVCYCRPREFCHRVLLANYISKLSGIAYNGEV